MTTHTAIETLGDLRDHAMSLSWYCADERCARLLGLTLARAIELFGADQVYIGWQPTGIKCAECGCRETTMIVQPVPPGYAIPGR
ncbi:hypothetical protein [Aurantimonas sp. 22II-16-19i]|uniref:hypothetical protein n=1 Tax=Aurantimonas sp. 22II-16-19i TaxID=1317114 RepID=UPI0009F7CC16|nr:hypothetical protein [Aurantimonas sp. 22II-16-19i]ORE91022.1 hypothetical protein ATO4_20209 [Aurantimonas sp. 22II-16-19i]